MSSATTTRTSVLYRRARAGGTIRVEVIDGGIGTAVPAADDSVTSSAVGVGGSGLRGLAERVTALGGHCEAGAVEGGGFRLMVIAPLTQATSGTQLASTANNAGDQNTIGASQA